MHIEMTSKTKSPISLRIFISQKKKIIKTHFIWKHMNYWNDSLQRFKDYYLECLVENQLLVYIERRDDLSVHYVHVNIELNQLVFPEHFL
jgi:hypothetical protein